MSDQKLLKLMAKGNSMAFSEVYNKYWDKLYYTVYDIFQDKATTDDIVQDVFVTLWKKRETTQIDNLSAYLYGAVKRKALQQLRNGKTADHHLTRLTHIQFGNNTEEQLNLKELQHTLETALAKLPEKCREVFELSRFENLSHSEIGERLHISPKTVANHINRALKTLRVSVGEFMTLFFIALISS